MELNALLKPLLRFADGKADLANSSVTLYVHGGRLSQLPFSQVISDVSAEISANANLVKIKKLEAEFFGGPLQIRGEIDQQDDQTVRLDLALAPNPQEYWNLLSKNWSQGRKWSVSGGTRFQGTIAGNLKKLEELQVKGDIRLEDLSLQRKEDPESRTQLQGMVSIDRLAEKLDISQLSVKRDRLSLDLSGHAQNIQRPEFSLRAANDSFEVQVSGHYERPKLAFERLYLVRGDSQASLAGFILTAAPRLFEFQGEAALQGKDLSVAGYSALEKLEHLEVQGLWQHRFQFKGIAEERRSWDGQWISRGDRMTWKDIDLGRSEMEVNVRRGMLRLSKLLLNPYEGNLEAVGEANLSQQGIPFQVEAVLRDLDLSLLAEREGVPESLYGKANAKLYWGGSTLLPESWNGQGTLLVREANLVAVPVLEEILALLRLVPNLSDTGRVHSVAGNFTLEKKRIQTSDLVFVTPELQIAVEGAVGLDQTLDLTVTSQASENLRKGSESAQTVGQIIDVIAGVVLPGYRITGTIKSPEIERIRPTLEKFFVPLLKQISE